MMQIDSLSRWNAVPNRGSFKHRRVGVSILYASAILFIASIGGVSALLFQDLDHPTTASEAAGSEYDISHGATFGKAASDLARTAADLTARVGALEVENQRLAAEMNQLLDHDGVIARLVTHVRALHAQSEATRRDVVGALMAPIPGVDPSMDINGVEPAGSFDGGGAPLLTKARHTVVTPVIAPAPAAAGAAAPEKPELAPAERQDGDTN